MDLSMFPPEIAALMQAQMLADQQSGGGNPVLAGNDALRQQFAAQPELAPPNSAQWLDQREQHLLGNDAPPIITAVAPAQSAPPPMLPPQAPQSPVQSAPQAPQQPPMLPPAPQAAPAPPPMPPASAPTLTQQAQITQLPQQAPVMSQVSPAPAVAAHANIDNNVTEPTRTFNPAYQPPPLPTFMSASLAPNLGGYRPAPQMPGYAMPRQGSPFMAPHQAQAPQQQPSFVNPFGGAGGYTAGGGASFGPGTMDPQTYSDSLFGRLLMPGSINPQF